MKCSNCGAENTVSGLRQISRTYKNTSVVFRDIQCNYCQKCEEITLDLVEGDRLFKLMKDFIGKVDAHS